MVLQPTYYPVTKMLGGTELLNANPTIFEPNPSDLSVDFIGKFRRQDSFGKSVFLNPSFLDDFDEIQDIAREDISEEEVFSKPFHNFVTSHIISYILNRSHSAY